MENELCKPEVLMAILVIFGLLYLWFCHHRWLKQSRDLSESEKRRRELGIKVVE
jgi:hypothetical protein